jgi:pimeloyl-ACP methyl ester carboxylesterase
MIARRPQRPRLGRWKGQGLPPRDRHVVIFVHGIFSNSSTFDKLLPILDELDSNDEFDFWVFDYKYLQPLTVSGDQLAHAIRDRAFGDRRVDIVGHSMGGLVARMAVLRNNLPIVRRIVTLATPNHGTISGAQINLLGQMTALGFRRLEPIYARASGIFDLTNVHAIMRAELKRMHAHEPARLDGKSYVSIPAQYFHTKRQLGETPPSMMRGANLIRGFINLFTHLRINLIPVHDGIVEERTNRLHPAPVGSSDEGAYMGPRAEAAKRMLHATHEAGSDCDHITVTASPEIADLIQAVLRADTLDEASIDPLLRSSVGLVRLRPHVD